MQKWRDDDLPHHGGPTISTVHIAAIDVIDRKDIYDLVINHVVSHRGKGFMYSIKSGSSIVKNGDVVLGTDDAAYEASLKAGEEAREGQIRELDESMQEHKVRS